MRGVIAARMILAGLGWAAANPCRGDILIDKQAAMQRLDFLMKKSGECLCKRYLAESWPLSTSR